MSQDIDAHTTAGYSDGVRSATVQTAVAADPVRVAVVMVVSPNEPAIALDSLIRAAALSPFHTTFFLADNTGDPVSLAGFPSQLDRRLVVLPVSNAPRPYFEIGRTVFSLLSQVAPLAPQIVIKIDPDTVILSPLFFVDLIDALDKGDFAAAQIAFRDFGSNFRSFLRLVSDVLPIGLTRTNATHRYGSITHLRLGRTWHWRGTLRALVGWRVPNAHPSGGGYGLSGRMLARLNSSGCLATTGSNGLEWNDDILLPLAIRALGGTIVDLRSTVVAPGWRWMHGSRYFEAEDIQQLGLRAVHPLRNTSPDLAIRHSLPYPTK